MSIKALSTSFVMKIAFEHRVHNATETFVILRDQKLATIAS